MNKNEIANQKNLKIKGVSRQIMTDQLIDFEEDQIIEVEKAESWTDGGEFKVETEREITYIFFIDNEIEVHQVDYDNEEECEILDCQDCYKEKEVLVAAGTKLRVKSFGDESELDTRSGGQGYIEVHLEVI